MIHQFDLVIGTIKNRQLARGAALKKGASAIEGKTAYLEVMWRIDDDDARYPGEWALAPIPGTPTEQEFREAGISWIASGDVQSGDLQC